MTRYSLLLIAFLAARVLADAPATRPAAPTVTEHELKLGDTTLKYKATTGFLPVNDDAGKEKASFFFIAYEKSDGKPEQRPITFVFNGGPGAASVWLHLGTAGPKRILFADDGAALPPPYKLVDNEHTWLDATDLVFIDPIGTGFSRPAPGEKGEQFFGLREDVASVAEFIRLYTTRYQRWPSPKFLAGESYGTTRAAGLSQHLVDRHGIALNGIVLVSCVLNFQTISPGEGNDIAYALYLPTYAATAIHFKRLPAELQKDWAGTLKQAEEFASGEYLAALTRGASMTPEQRKSAIDKLARFTGLPAAFIDRSDLRVSPSEFRKRLLEDQRNILGRFDARIAGFDPDPTDSRAEYDPSLTQYLAAYSGTFNDYVRRTLRFESDLAYEVLSDRVHPWNWGHERGYVNVAGELRSAMIRLPHLKVMVASGYFDLATPYYAADYTVNRMDLSKELRANITQAYYTGGHMMYHNKPDLEKLHKDVSGFIKGAVK